MVRPESIHVGRRRRGARPASLTGRIVQTSFLGSQTRVAVALRRSARLRSLASLFGRERLAARDLDPGHGGDPLVGA